MNTKTFTNINFQEKCYRQKTFKNSLFYPQKDDFLARTFLSLNLNFLFSLHFVANLILYRMNTKAFRKLHPFRSYRLSNEPSSK